MDVDQADKKRQRKVIVKTQVPGFDLEEVTYVYSSAGFEPLYLEFECVEAGMTTRSLTVAILLPSRVCQADLSIRVADGGCTLNATVA